MRYGHVTSGVLGALWLFVLAITFSIALSFGTGDAFRPFFYACILLGAGLSVAMIYRPMTRLVWAGIAAAVLAVAAVPNWSAVVTGTPVSAETDVLIDELTADLASTDLTLPADLERRNLRAAIAEAGVEIPDGLETTDVIRALQASGGALPDVIPSSLRLFLRNVLWAALLGAVFGFSQRIIQDDLPHPGAVTRHEYEEAIIRFLTGFGYIFFTAIVLIPFYIMVMTSLKNKAELSQNPLDFSIDLSKGWELFGSYVELFEKFNFGTYLVNSALISVITVLLTLAFAIPGAYAVARLRFKGAAAFSRSILLIYMVPMIVLALPIYVVYSMTGLRNTMVGMVLIYPVTTIPVALYMLQGYFRGLPSEVEEAGLMDGLSRLKVIWKITLPLSLPALASVSLYVFMIAWNEFLLAQILLDDPSIFTLPKGVYTLNSSEVSSQTLMAGAVVATLPIMAIFLFLERFMTKGLTAGSVKG